MIQMKKSLQRRRTRMQARSKEQTETKVREEKAGRVDHAGHVVERTSSESAPTVRRQRIIGLSPLPGTNGAQEDSQAPPQHNGEHAYLNPQKERERAKWEVEKLEAEEKVAWERERVMEKVD